MPELLLPLALSKATQVRVIDTHHFEGEVSPDFCYASAHTKPTAHGGYVGSIILQAIKKYFTTTAAHLNQPDTYTCHFRFLEASNAGPVTVSIRDVKLGKNSSTIHFSAAQSLSATPSIVGYATNFNISSRSGTGFTVPTGPLLTPAPFPVDFAALALGTDPHWTCHQTPWTPDHRIKSQTQCRFALPRTGHPAPNVSDGWIAPAQPGERFTNASLGWLCDQWPQGVPGYRPETPDGPRGAAYGLMNTPRGIWGAPMWYPTLTMDVELKKALPEEGVEWVFVRSRARLIQDGRMDMEVLVFDPEMELVALSHHVCFVISLKPKRGEGSDGKGKGKL